MILARVLSGFAGKKVWDDIQVVPGFWGGKDGFLGSRQLWSPQVEPLPKEILGAITQRDTGSYYPKRYWELLPKEILGAINQRDIGMSYGKMEEVIKHEEDEILPAEEQPLPAAASPTSDSPGYVPEPDPEEEPEEDDEDPEMGILLITPS
ncbi:hypothetical protein Tco_0692071 [Tanacetum coccineum]